MRMAGGGLTGEGPLFGGQLETRGLVQRDDGVKPMSFYKLLLKL